MSFEKVPNFLLNSFEAEMKGEETHSYRFNSFLLDVAERQLFRNGKPISLTPKAFDALVYLIEHAGHLVLKDELMQAVWPDSFVDEVNVPRTVHTIRATLGEDSNGNKFIETVPTKGYRFVARVVKVNGNGAGPSPLELAPTMIGKRPERSENADAGDSSVVGKQYGGPSNRRRTVLIGSFIVILTVSVTGFWVANRSGRANKGVNSVTQQTNNSKAFEHFLRGRLLIQRGYAGELDEALTHFENAIKLDPGYAAAYAGKADAKMQIFWGSNLHDDIAQARTAIDRAICVGRI
jgi:DNA-binding winged helix-turn-helix (wHTH) protein